MIFSHGIPIQRVEPGVTLSHSLLGPGVQQKSRAPPHLRTGSRETKESQDCGSKDLIFLTLFMYIYIYV